MVSNSSEERSFLKTKLIKNRLLTSMLAHDRLSHLALMSIKADILREINFEDLVTKFVKKKMQSSTNLTWLHAQDKLTSDLLTVS